LLTRDDFKAVELSDKVVFDKHYKMFPQLHSDYLFSTMMCWKHYMKYYYVLIDNSIIIMTEQGNNVKLRPPIGKPSADLDMLAIKFALEECTDPPYSMIDSNAKKRLLDQFPKLDFTPHREFFEYIYLATDLRDLKGKNYLKIRNQLNHFKKHNEYSIQPITSENMQEVNKFLNRWCLWRDCDKDIILKNEKDAVLYSIDHFFELDLSGIIIIIYGNIEAAAIFETQNENTAVIHFEKAIPDFKGLYQAINQETAKILAETHKFINRESDMGIPGLRVAKEKYHPHHMVEVYHLNREQLSSI